MGTKEIMESRPQQSEATRVHVDSDTRCPTHRLFLGCSDILIFI